MKEKRYCGKERFPEKKKYLGKEEMFRMDKSF